jgi:glucose-1-phosphate thymidylyltransferase
MLGILLAGGFGTRLGPVTRVTSKQLLPIYDKPMIYYPISLLMASGIDEIIVITSPRDLSRYKDLLQDGHQWGISIQYVEQFHPNGLPEAFLLCEDKIKNRSVTLMLGDNIIYGSQVGRKLSENRTEVGASIFGYLVKDVSSFGTIEIDLMGQITSLREKPANGGQGLAIPGIYHFDSSVTSRTRSLCKSERGELEIIDLLKSYFVEGLLNYSILDRGTAWLDTGTIEDLSMASELVRVVQSRQGMLVGSPDEVAFRRNLISRQELRALAESLSGSLYGKALLEISLEAGN